MAGMSPRNAAVPSESSAGVELASGEAFALDAAPQDASAQGPRPEWEARASFELVSGEIVALGAPPEDEPRQGPQCPWNASASFELVSGETVALGAPPEDEPRQGPQYPWKAPASFELVSGEMIALGVAPEAKPDAVADARAAPDAGGQPSGGTRAKATATATATGRSPRSGPTEVLVAPLVQEMIASWHQGKPRPVEDYLARHPALPHHSEVVTRLILEEIRLRRALGQEVSTAEYRRRFPQWEAHLADLIDATTSLPPLSSWGASPLPMVGEALGEFQLLAMLGRGIQGSVFLALQPGLANRPVVLKLTPRKGSEHLTLARLQHAHIVPLYWVQDLADRDLRVLCMPYLGGTTLAQILDLLEEIPLELRSGRDVLAALDAVRAEAVVAMSAQGPSRQFLARASYVQAICWIGACLADALHFAHQRALLHLDLKPSNILLTADGTPMLLDFHLAQPPIRPDGPPLRRLGGTPAYMSPEQWAATQEARGNRPVVAEIDDRSDIYALGRVLYEAFCGICPVGCEPPILQRFPAHPHIPVGLADIISRCLEYRAQDRYPDAAVLAEDLRRQLADLPLKGVANRSWSERWWKWRRRCPQALGRLLTAVLAMAAVLVAVLVLTNDVRQRLARAEAALTEGRRSLDRRDYPAAAAATKHGLTLTHPWQVRAVGHFLPRVGHLRQSLATQLRRAQRAEKAEDIHRLVDRLRLLWGTEDWLSVTVQALEPRLRSNWEARAPLLAQARGELKPEDVQRLEADLLELAIFWANLRVRLAPDHESDRRRREALRILAEAEEQLGSHPVLERDRQTYAEALGLHDLARAAAERRTALAPVSAWEHYTLGRSLFDAGDFEAAAREFAASSEIQPQDLWSHFSRGLCAYRLRHFDAAVAAFDVCVALAPKTAECYYNRARAHAALGQTQAALRDYNHALNLAPDLAVAALNRGVLHFKQGCSPEAIADFQRALAGKVSPAKVHYNLALAYLAQGDPAAARTNLEAALRLAPGEKAYRDLECRLPRDRRADAFRR